VVTAFRAVALVFALAVGLYGAARADPPGSPFGRWRTQDGNGVVELLSCGSAVCGRIVGMGRPVLADGSPRKDWSGRPQCGLTILHDAHETAPGVWSGRITDPEDGSDWKCEFWLDGSANLRLRGYVVVPLLGQTQKWTRFIGNLSGDCRIG
jgi:uncharacterized protein (DUF2147 family)